MQSILKSLGFSSDSAYTGTECIAKVQERKNSPCGPACVNYSLIIMDCDMPMMNGFECTKKLKKMMQSNRIPEIPIIGCTAYVSEDKLRECALSGMNETLKKPVQKKQGTRRY